MSFVKIWSQFYNLLRKKMVDIHIQLKGLFYSSFLERIKCFFRFDKGNLVN